MKIPTIETPRLYLRGFQKEDARFAAGIWNDAEMGEYLPDEAMEELDEEYLHQLEQLGEDEECCYLIAEDKQSGERIGTCSFLPKDGVYDLAYCVHKQFWGRGYATEMAKGMAEYARSSKAKAVTIWVTEGNNASVRVAQKLGCVQDAAQDLIVGMLNWQIQVVTDFRLFLHRLNEFRIDVLRIAVQNPDPVELRNFAELF